MLKSMDKMDFKVVLPEGRLTDEGRCVWKELSREKKLDFYRWMVQVRQFDRRSILLQRQGRIGTYAPIAGQEAAQVGSALALSKEDWIFPSYREVGVNMVAGIPLKQILLHWMGRVEGNRFPEGSRVLPPYVPIATQLPQAMGAAWAAKMKKEPSVAVAYFGDGATSEGDFHEALNFAGVFRLPVIFFCQNNQYAISTPFRRQSAVPTVAERAAAYHIPGIRVDGNDVVAVHIAMEQAVSRGKQGEGATLIEAVTYRHGAHTTADDATRYREAEEVEEWVRNRDPIHRLEVLLKAEGLLTDADIRDWEEASRQVVEHAVKEAESVPAPAADHLFAHVYEKMPLDLIKQKRDV